MNVDKSMFVISLVTLVFAVILCGAVAAAAPTEVAATKTVSAYTNMTVTIYSTTQVTAKGEKLYVENSVKNLGSTTSKAFYTKYYLVPTKTLLGSKIYLGKQFFPSMLEGNYDKVVSSFTVTNNMSAGSYYVAAVIDKTQIAYSPTKTLVYPKKIDSGFTNVKTYGQYKWSTYQTGINKDVISYAQFYNPNIAHMMKQKTVIAKYIGTGGYTLYMYLEPKLTGHSNWWNGMGIEMTALQYYWNIFRPDMIESGPFE